MDGRYSDQPLHGGAVDPKVVHHSMIVEIGGRILRHREFLLYHSDSIYPEYLVAYQRH